MQRVYNFSAGPAILPTEVLEQAQAELLDFKGCGMSVMEMSHRSKEFMEIATTAESDLRELLAIPNNYKVLFMQGGASAQFALIPLNLLGSKSTADYFDTGIWSGKAIKEARQHCTVNIVASGKDSDYCRLAAPSKWRFDEQAAYLHYTPNETIGGFEFHEVPDSGAVPLVADMSSTILSRPIDVSRFGLIYAGAQKNIGPAGLTIVIVRDDLLGKAAAHTPAVFNYAAVAEQDSMLNTPPTYAWYIAGLVFKWLKARGGLQKMAELNQRKANKLYQLIEQSNYYNNPVAADYRSWMNVPFTLADANLDAQFLEEAGQAGLTNLKGHRAVGGMRASIYNAMPEAGIDALCEFMQDFQRRCA